MSSTPKPHSERDDVAYANTDRELWREGGGDGDGMSYYEPSIHVTEQGGIGINVGGTIYVKTLREWHGLEEQYEKIHLEHVRVLGLLLASEEQLEAERKAWRKALDSALQYVPLKDHDFIEAIVSNPASVSEEVDPSPKEQKDVWGIVPASSETPASSPASVQAGVGPGDRSPIGTEAPSDDVRELPASSPARRPT